MQPKRLGLKGRDSKAQADRPGTAVPSTVAAPTGRHPIGESRGVCISGASGRLTRRRGWSLVEVMIVLTLVGILISMSVPSFHRAIEQSRANLAAANLQAIWTAQRIYWLEHRSYTDSLSDLEAIGLLDRTVVSGDAAYVFAITSADSKDFTAVARRTGSARWRGELAIEQTGLISGVIQAKGETEIVPGFR